MSDSAELREYGEASEGVRSVYAQNHRRQTLAFVREKKAEYGSLDRRKMGVWEAVELLEDLVDDSDPDTGLGQTEHLLQTAESIRRAGLPDWFVLTGLLHDLGKVLCVFGEPQWAVVGDTFPVGCAFSNEIVYADLFFANPDVAVEEYRSPLGIYQAHCGFDAVEMSWGHDEYLYRVLEGQLPEEALYVIRYHSFYAAHGAGGYRQLMNERDHRMLPWLHRFSRHDLYSKTDERPPVEELRGRYESLIEAHLPGPLRW